MHLKINVDESHISSPGNAYPFGNGSPHSLIFLMELHAESVVRIPCCNFTHAFRRTILAPIINENDFVAECTVIEDRENLRNSFLDDAFLVVAGKNQTKIRCISFLFFYQRRTFVRALRVGALRMEEPEDLLYHVITFLCIKVWEERQADHALSNAFCHRELPLLCAKMLSCIGGEVKRNVMGNSTDPFPL